MTRPRKELVCIDDTPYYHVVSRCVRRAFLCGFDKATGKSYEHRREWVEARIHLLASIFAIDIAAYSVMSNHYHLVVKLSPNQLKNLSDKDIFQRWTMLFKGPLLVQQYLNGEPLIKAQRETLSHIAHVYRKRLSDLSWFMRCLNQPIAREANKEDNCTGHFFEGRYYSQALLTEEALLSCMAYVDLNSIRAGIATTPENSKYTSIQERINPSAALRKTINELLSENEMANRAFTLKPLLPFEGFIKSKTQTGVLFQESDYLELVDQTGRCYAPNKKGMIPSDLPYILERLNLDRDLWLRDSRLFESVYQRRFSKQALQRKNAS